MILTCITDSNNIVSLFTGALNSETNNVFMRNLQCFGQHTWHFAWS